MRDIRIGDRVAYSAAWLRSTGQVATTYDIAGWRGTITSMLEFGPRALVTVKWDHGAEGKVLDANLARVGTPAMSAN